MTAYLLLMTLNVGAFLPLPLPEGAILDTLVNGEQALRLVKSISGPNEAAVILLEANGDLPLVSDSWQGELFRINLETKTLRPVRLPKIRAASDTLEVKVRPWD